MGKDSDKVLPLDSIMEDGIEDAVYIGGDGLTEDEVKQMAIDQEMERRERLIVNRFGSTPFRMIGSSRNDDIGSLMTVHGMEVPGGVLLKVFEKIADNVSLSTEFIPKCVLEEDGESGTWKLVYKF